MSESHKKGDEQMMSHVRQSFAENLQGFLVVGANHAEFPASPSSNACIYPLHAMYPPEASVAGACGVPGPRHFALACARPQV